MKVLSYRPMTDDDLAIVATPCAKARLKSIRDGHHIVARLIASGLTNAEIAAECGYTMYRISILRSDPAMAELVSTYRSQDNESWRQSRDQYYDRIHRVSSKAWAQMEDQLDEAEETNTKLPINRLLAIGDSGADRIGYMRRSMNINANVDFAKKLEDAISRSSKVIETKPLE